MKASYCQHPPLNRQQSGVVLLLFVVVLLIVLTTIITVTSRNTVIETRMTTNFIDAKVAFNAANTATFQAMDEVKNLYGIDSFIDTNQANGLYDLRRVDDGNDQVKKQTAWDALLTRNSLNSQEALKSNVSNINIQDAPDYIENDQQSANQSSFAIGIHDSFLVEGSEGMHCLPVSIIGLGHGQQASTISMVELKMVPKSTCYRSKIR